MNAEETILVADDDHGSLKLLTGMLSRAGYQVRSAEGGDLALASATSEPPDLIMLDVRMPDMDGIEVLRRLKAHPQTADVPVMLMSGVAETPEQVEGLDLGVMDYIAKPFEPRELLARVQNRLKLVGLRREVQRQAAEVSASELRYRRLFESAKDGILILDAETGMIVDVNPFLVELLGYSTEAFHGKRVWELGFLKNVVANEANFLELKKKEYIRYENMPLETHDGRRIDVEFVSNVYLVNEQKVIQCNIRDITERVQSEVYRETSWEVLQILNDPGTFPDSIQRVMAALQTRTGFDAVGLRLQDGEDFPYYAQQGFSTDFLQKENTLLERDAGGGVCRDKDGNVCLECTCGLVISGKTDASSPLFTKGGSFWTNDSSSLLELSPDQDPRHHPRNTCIHDGYASVVLVPIRNKDRIVGLIHLNDRRRGCCSVAMVEHLETIAAHIGAALMRKLAEEALRASEQELRSLAESMPQIVWATRADGWNIYFNQQWVDYTGMTLAQSYGHGWNTPFHPDDRQRAWDAWQRATQHNEPYSIECRLRRADGVYRWWLVRGVPHLNANGEILKWFGTCTDIEDIKQAHAQHDALQVELAQAQKLESVGRLAGGVAHDFNNLLMGIMGYVELCCDEVGPDHPIREWLDEIMREARRSADIARQLLAFARKQTIAPEVLDLNAAVEGMLKLLRRLIGEDINLVWLPGMNVRPVKLDPSQVDQILANLCVNARDAIAGVGNITVETGNVTIDKDDRLKHAEIMPGAYVFLAVSDDGRGIDPETLGQVFEPFFTTKGLGKGTGLGLATVYGIVKQNNGFVYAYSELGHGTTVKIYLPQVVAAEVAQAASVKAAKPPHGTETVLLVEDEKSVRVTAHLFLEALGYTALVAADPEAALIVAAEHPGAIDLLITDVIMPGMSGRDLADRLLEARPSIQCLFISGFTADVIAQRGILEDGVNFLSKPFGRDALARKVREVLDE